MPPEAQAPMPPAGPKDRMMASRQPPQANPMEMLMGLTPDAVTNMDPNDAKDLLSQVVATLQESKGPAEGAEVSGGGGMPPQGM